VCAIGEREKERERERKRERKREREGRKIITNLPQNLHRENVPVVLLLCQFDLEERVQRMKVKLMRRLQNIVVL
jgi:hypothetical protein